MKSIDASFAAIAVFSAVMLTYRWLSLYGKTDYVINFYAGMLVAAIALLILRR
ncbi:hypothetical protein [Archaeoglobus sp.]